MPTLALVTSGSGGDLLPFLALARALKADGHEAHLIAPPLLSIAARASGHRVIGVGGPGEHVDFTADSSLLKRSLDGSHSWRRLLDRYAVAELPLWRRTASLLESLAVDAVVVHPFAFFGRVAAKAVGVPQVALHLFPSFLSSVEGVGLDQFAPHLWRALEVEVTHGAPGIAADRWTTSFDENLVAHEQWFWPATSQQRPALPFVGFPSIDGLVPAGDLEEVLEWVSDSSPAAVVAFSTGTFIGHVETSFWDRAYEVTRDLGIRSLFVNVPRPDQWARDTLVKATGFLPLEAVLKRCKAVVHLGGLGMTYGCIMAGCPTVVVPLAFDQGFNASVVDHLGAGVMVQRSADLASALRSVLNTDSYRERAAELAGRMSERDDPAVTTARQVVNQVV